MEFFSISRDDCREQISNFPGAWYKKFKTEHEADKCMRSKEIALKSSGLSTYTAQRIADYVPPTWALPNTRSRVSPPDDFSVQVRASNTRDNEKLLGRGRFRRKDYSNIDYYTLKVPGLNDRYKYLEDHVTSLYTR